MSTAWPGYDCTLFSGEPGSPGMTFNSKIDIPSGCTGTLEYLQLIDRCLEKRNLSGDYKRRKTGGYVLDTSDPYASKGVTSSGAIDFSTNDSPGAGAIGWNYIFITDRFKMWLLWTPSSPSFPSSFPYFVGVRSCGDIATGIACSIPCRAIASEPSSASCGRMPPRAGRNRRPGSRRCRRRAGPTSR